MTTIAAPERIETERMILRRPIRGDAEAILERYSSDAEVTRFLAWPRHTSIDDVFSFLAFSDGEWRRWGGGPYLACSRHDGAVLGSTGLAFEASDVASTGYVFARDSWGLGYATESLRAMVSVAHAMRLRRLYAMCHVDHRASSHVLEKCGFVHEGVLPGHLQFPNLSRTPADVHCYAIKP